MNTQIKLASELTEDQKRRINKFYASYTAKDFKEGAMKELAEMFNTTEDELYKVIDL
jgi:hypothetical protein